MSEMFSSVFTPMTLTHDTEMPDSSVEQRWEVDVSVNATSKLLSQVKLKKTAGSDNLSARLLRSSHDSIAAPLTHLFAISVENGKVPTRWKMANISPIPKSGNPSINNFRPVSLLPIPSKILEKIVLASVKPKLIDMYGENQFGFRPNSSTLNAHLLIHDFVTRMIDSPLCDGVVMIALDLSKAFDRLSHLALLQNLSHKKFPVKFFSWIQDFLSQRTQRVVFEGSQSSQQVHVKSGVPQGSVLARNFLLLMLARCNLYSQKQR